MFESFFSFVALTSRSPARAFSPTIMPSYTSTPGPHEELTALLQVEQREGAGGTAPIRDEAPRRPRSQLAVPGLVAVEDVVEDAGAPRLGQELGAEADEPPRGHEVLHSNPTGAVVDELLEPSLAQREQLRDHAHVLLGRVDRESLDRFVERAVHLSRDHLRLADRELEALASHQLDQNRELELATALHLPRVRSLGREDA